MDSAREVMAVFWIAELPTLRKNVLPASNCVIVGSEIYKTM
jgi:hypothetical protein